MTKAKNGARRGRRCVFRDKDGGVQIHGVITEKGAHNFERARKRLAQLAPWVKSPSDADVIEFLAIGEQATKDYIRRHGEA